MHVFGSQLKLNNAGFHSGTQTSNMSRLACPRKLPERWKFFCQVLFETAGVWVALFSTWHWIRREKVRNEPQDTPSTTDGLSLALFTCIQPQLSFCWNKGKGLTLRGPMRWPRTHTPRSTSSRLREQWSMRVRTARTCNWLRSSLCLKLSEQWRTLHAFQVRHRSGCDGSSEERLHQGGSTQLLHPCSRLHLTPTSRHIPPKSRCQWKPIPQFLPMETTWIHLVLQSLV